jgi:hypothetical protein
VAGVALVLAGPVFTTVSTLGQATEMMAQAQTLDDLDRQARQARANGELSPAIALDPTAPQNSCIATYYGLDSIRPVGADQA